MAKKLQKRQKNEAKNVLLCPSCIVFFCIEA